MDTTNDILVDAIKKRIRAYRNDVVINFLIGVLSIFAGVVLFGFLWVYFRQDDSKAVQQLVSSSGGLVTFGVGVMLVTKQLAIRSKIRCGKDWLEMYSAALGPPPQAILPDLTQRILSWLEKDT